MVTRGEAGIDAWPPEQTAPIREAEEIESARLVGVDSVTFLDYRDGMVEYGLALRRDLAREIRRFRPEALAIGGFDLAWPGGSSTRPITAPSGWPPATPPATPAIAGSSRSCWPRGSSRGAACATSSSAAAHQPTHACDVASGLEQGIASLVAQQRLLREPGPAVRRRCASCGARRRRHGERFGVAAAAAFQVLYV